MLYKLSLGLNGHACTDWSCLLFRLQSSFLVDHAHISSAVASGNRHKHCALVDFESEKVTGIDRLWRLLTTFILRLGCRLFAAKLLLVDYYRLDLLKVLWHAVEVDEDVLVLNVCAADLVENILKVVLALKCIVELVSSYVNKIILLG